MKIRNINQNKGFIALASAIIISAVLLLIITTASASTFFARFDSLGSENKRMSLTLSESCIDLALLKISQNPDYQTDNITDGDYILPPGCTILPIKYFCDLDYPYDPDPNLCNVRGYNDDSNTKIATIKATAQYNDSFSNIEANYTVYDPAYTLPSRVVLGVYPYGDGAGNNPEAPEYFGPFTIGTKYVSLGQANDFSPGSYEVIEGNPDSGNYDVSVSGGCKIINSKIILALGVNDYKTCNIIHTLKPKTASLTIKILSSDGTMPDHLRFGGGDITVKESQIIKVSNVTDVENPFQIETYFTNPNNGYAFSNWAGDCSDSINTAGQIKLRKGDNKICAIALEKQTGSNKAAITVVTRVINNYDENHTPIDFTVNVDAKNKLQQSESITDKERTTIYYIDPDEFHITQTAKPENYETQITNTGDPYLCEGTAVAGHGYVCLITNNDIPTTFTLTPLVNINRAYGIAPVPNFTLALSGPSTKNLISGIAESGLFTGNYTISLSGVPSTYTISEWGSDCSGSYNAGTVSWSTGDKRYKICEINIVENPPPFRDIDTVLMLDRTGSMFWDDDWIGGERVASKAFLDLFSAILPPRPQVGIGVFANDNGNSAKIAGYLTSNYNNEGNLILNPKETSHYNPTTQWQPTPSSQTKTTVVSDASDSTYISATSQSSVQTFITSNTSSIPNGERINSVTITARAKGNPSSWFWYPKIGFRIEQGTGSSNYFDYSPSSNTVSGNFKEYSITIPTMDKNPFTNQDWTINELNSLGFGVIKTNSSGTLIVSKIIVSINYGSNLYKVIDDNLADSEGGTDLSAAISVGNGELNSSRHISGHKKYLILLSDGEPTYPGNGQDITQGAIDAALSSATTAKNSGTEIYTIHFGNVSNLPNPYTGKTSRDLTALLATNSANDKPTITQENNDDDHFFIVEATADPTTEMTNIFNKIGQQIISAETPPTATTGTLNVITQVFTNNTNHPKKIASDFTVNLHDTINPIKQLPELITDGNRTTTYFVGEGYYRVTESTDSNYLQIVDPQCEGEIDAGQEVTCIIINDDAIPSTAPSLPTPVDPPSATLKPTLVVVTRVNDPSGASNEPPSHFTINIDNPSHQSFGGDETDPRILNIGNYNVEPVSDSDYTFYTSADCSGYIEEADIKTCVVVYTANPPSDPPVDIQQNIDLNSWKES